MGRRVSMFSRVKLLVIASILVICICVFLLDLFNFQRDPPVVTIAIKHREKIPSRPLVEHKKEKRELSCKIPLTPIWPEYFQNWNPKKFVQNCSHEQNLFELQDDKIVLLQNSDNSSCCLHEIIRGNNDSVFSLSECEPLSTTLAIDDKEAILVKCGNYVNFDANIPMKPNVQEKLLYWEGISDEERPFNVYILGIDTVSRSHAFRSLNKTMEVLKRMDFVDFEAYHSIAPSTLTNFMAMLMGLTRTEVRGGCAKDWATPFDDCPMVWSNFSENNYVTAYVEDGAQSFNWGGQSGFVEQPTDYYLHHLFLQLTEIRDAINNSTNNPSNNTIDCTSKETVPEFLLRYTKKWLTKFANTPYFFFSWFAYPFHENIYSLANFDDNLAKFFAFLQSQPALMQRSLIIFSSDHGDRMSFFNGKSVESYFERGLPQLFIRLPDKLKENYPDVVQTFKANAKKLTTPFDIHHTLLHVLSLNSNLDLVAKSYEPEMSDRSSLFVEVSTTTRDCKGVNIPPTNCLCNAQYNPKVKGASVISTGFANKLLQFCIDKLNMKVTRSNYSHLCSRWTSIPKNIIYTRIITDDPHSREILLAFTASPGEAKFEAKLSINKHMLETVNNIKVSDFVELVGFSRINRYGDQSWCIPTTTDHDKEMKELCMCREQRS